MQGVIAICHFCETHGPRVLMTCQPMREIDSCYCSSSIHPDDILLSRNVDELSTAVSMNNCSPDSGTHDDNNANGIVDPSLAQVQLAMSAGAVDNERKQFYGNYLTILRRKVPGNSHSTNSDELLRKLATDDGVDEPTTSTHRSGELFDDEERCAACTSFGDDYWQPGLLTNDHATRTSFVSAQVAYYQRVAGMLKRACLRSLSCEVAPGAESKGGAVFFGDDTANEHTLSYTFTLRDAMARGFQHWYSIVIVSTDKLMLLNSYAFLVSSLSAVISYLQMKANEVFEREQTGNELRLSTASRASMLPSGWFRIRRPDGALDSNRSLTSLTGEPDIFRRLHRYFVWIMMNQSKRCVEYALEGLPTQDMLVQMERAVDATEVERFAANAIRHQEESSRSPSSSVCFCASARSDDDESEDGDHQQQSSTVTHLQPLDDLKLLARRLSAPPNAHFRSIVHRLIIGEQLIVVSDVEPPALSLVARVLSAFSYLLPAGCVRMTALSDEYLHLYQCNLLGLTRSTSLPDDIGDGIVLRVTSGGTLATCALQVVANSTFDTQQSAPSMLSRIEQLLLKEDLPLNVLDATLRSLREDWLNKSKLVFQLSRGGSSGGASQRDVAMRIVASGATTGDEQLLQFWQAGLSRSYKQYILNNAASCNNHRLSSANS